MTVDYKDYENDMKMTKEKGGKKPQLLSNSTLLFIFLGTTSNTNFMK